MSFVASEQHTSFEVPLINLNCYLTRIATGTYSKDLNDTCQSNSRLFRPAWCPAASLEKKLFTSDLHLEIGAKFKGNISGSGRNFAAKKIFPYQTQPTNSIPAEIFNEHF